MMISQNSMTLLIILSLHFFQTCTANCTPSACGILCISFPFRLKGDSKHCSDRSCELVCENNVASVNLNSHKYYVKAIDYSDFTIRLVDVSINTCSLPVSSAYEINYFDPYQLDYANQPVTFMSCQHPLRNSSFATSVTDCEEGTGRHSYIKVGHLRLTDVDYMCTLDSVLATSWNFTDLDNVSLSEIHQSLLYGFHLSWRDILCRNCSSVSGCYVSNGKAICLDHHSRLYYKWEDLKDFFRKDPSLPLLIFLLVVAVLFAGVNLPAKIFIIGLGVLYWVLVRNWRFYVRRIHVVSFEVRFIVGSLCTMLFLIYKFRRRCLSMYEEIEGFLQSDNKLSPIRYSYSEIRRMTRGFRDELGQGGFGSVYKGKLRSSHHVAVKLLRKATANGKDFTNEIGTIGRIHHVNVIKLVGYCAEGSKRALIFDFMPNGSLDKYIFDREKECSLDWDTKFKIAVGVARIEYLHRDCDIQILHFDIKPHNILLDDKFVPKISDFGLAKLCSIEKDMVTLIAARGTIGYVAPELINRGIGGVSYKADVYSFGMLLMEMVGLNREPRRENNDESTKYFPYWIYESFNQGREIEIVKAEENYSDDENESRKSLVRKMTIVALWCIQINPNDRPSMNKVLGILEGDVERLRIPEYPSQSKHMVVTETKTETDSVSLLHYNNDSSIEITIA